MSRAATIRRPSVSSALVDDAPDVRRVELVRYLPRVPLVLCCDRRNDHLFGSKPERKRTAMMLEEHGDKTFDAAKDGMMQHHWSCARTRRSNERGVETLRQHEIDLDRSALPLASIAILQNKFELGAIEGALARLHAKLEARRTGGAREHRFSLIPYCIGTVSRERSRRETHVELIEPKTGIDLTQEAAEACHFVVNLLEVPLIAR